MIKLLKAILLAFIASSPVAGAQVDIPSDGGKFHLTVIGSGDPAFSQLTEAFLEDRDLSAIREQCHFHWVLANHRIATNYRRKGTPLPVVRLQDNKGRVIFEKAGNINVANLAAEMWQHQCEQIDPCPNGQCFRNRRQPAPLPKIQPYVEPKPEPPRRPVQAKPKIIINDRPAPMPMPKPQTMPPAWLLGLVALGGAALAIFVQIRRNP